MPRLGPTAEAPILDEVGADLRGIEAEQSTDIDMRQAPTEQVMHMPHRAAQERGHFTAGPEGIGDVGGGRGGGGGREGCSDGFHTPPPV